MTDLCPRCHGTREIGSEITHGNGWTIAIDRKTEPCPVCANPRKRRTMSKTRKASVETRHDHIDWDSIINNVQDKLRYLRLAWQTSERDCAPELHKKMVEDIYLPAVTLLAQFCASVEVEDE